MFEIYDEEYMLDGSLYWLIFCIFILQEKDEFFNDRHRLFNKKHHTRISFFFPGIFRDGQTYGIDTLS